MSTSSPDYRDLSRKCSARTRRLNFAFRILGIAGLVALCPISSSAQVLEEVVVSAQKREQSLSDVGMAVSAFSGEQIDQLGYTNTIDVAAQTPGRNIFQY